MTDRPNRLRPRPAVGVPGIFGEGNTDLDVHIEGLNQLHLGRWWYKGRASDGRETLEWMPIDIAQSKGLIRPAYSRAA